MARSEGYRTKSRQLIYEYLQRNIDRIVYVNEIYEVLHEQGNTISITTIYRYLDRLVADGFVMKYAADSGEKAGYQLVKPESDCHRHLHLQCIHCGKVIHLDCEFMEEITNHISKEHGFDLFCKNSIIYGCCKECKKKS